ncbi:MAG: hypothetical protein RJA20_1886 [Bacteroidota bacterium]
MTLTPYSVQRLFCAGIKPHFNILLALVCVYASAHAQQATLRGVLQDAAAAAPLSYANVRVYKVADNQLAGGALSAEDGTFSVQLPYGTYHAEVEYIGFETVKTDTFNLSKARPVYDIGILTINATARSLGEVEIVAEKSSMVLSLDKKIFNVGKDLANAGGSATEILTNIPSVSVDPDGTVKLRGSDNVRILIDGKPSGLVSFKGSAGLQQLQASMIDRVEIITNPSARYEAEGSGGIINIVLKKDQKQGFNGSFELISGYPYNFGASANLNYRHNKINFFINYGISHRKSPGGGDLYQRRTSGDTTFILLQSTENKTKILNNNIRGGLDYFFTEKSVLTASCLWRRSDANRLSYIRYEDYLFSTDNPLGYTLRNQDETEDEPNSEYSLIYRRKFSDEGHELTAEAKYLNYWEHSDQSFPQNTYFPNGTEDVSKALFEKSLNDEYENQYLFQLDYVRPLGKDGKFETGLRSSFRDMVNDYQVTSRNTNGVFEVIPGLDNYFIYNENINGAYLIYGNKRNKFSWQGGLRAEHTDIETILRETGETNPRNYFNFFPSAHVTYELPDGHAIQWSYSRRVRRPSYNDLSPFFTYTDKRNYWSGNPDLNPEFSDVVEVGHVKYFDQGSMASSVYFRHTDAKIDQIRLLDTQGLARTRPENLNFENALGFEFTTGYNPVKWCKLDANFNLFHARIDGSNLDATFTTTTNSWFARLTSRFMLPHDFDFQLRGNYEAPQNTAQGKRKALYYLDLAASLDVLQKKGTLTLNVSDMFNTRKWRGITEGADFYTESSFQWRRRQINLTFNYRIKQSKPVQKKVDE